MSSSVPIDQMTMTKRILTILLSLILALGVLLLAAILLIPDQVERAWQLSGLPEGYLLQVESWLGKAEPAATEIRMYGTLEARVTHAMSELNGRAVEVMVEEGDWVEAGQPLIRLDSTDVQAQIAAAEEALAAAQAARDAAAAPPGPEIRRVADSAVKKAQAELENAQRILDHARNVRENPVALNAQINQTAALIPVAQAQVEAANAAIKQTDVLIGDAITDGSREGKYKVRILQAQKAAAQASLEAAQARLNGLIQTLALLKKMREEPLALDAQVHQAEGALRVAEAALRVAEAERAAKTAPPQPEVVAVAEAGVQQAQAALDLARWGEDRLTILAPASGRVQAKLIDKGETVTPGKPLITLADTRQMEIWVYVAAGDLHRIHVNDVLPVDVLAIPDERFQAQVFYIAPKAQFRPSNVLNPDDRGDMVFLVKLRLDNGDGRLKPGMPADVILPLE